MSWLSTIADRLQPGSDRKVNGRSRQSRFDYTPVEGASIQWVCVFVCSAFCPFFQDMFFSAFIFSFICSPRLTLFAPPGIVCPSPDFVSLSRGRIVAVWNSLTLCIERTSCLTPHPFDCFWFFLLHCILGCGYRPYIHKITLWTGHSPFFTRHLLSPVDCLDNLPKGQTTNNVSNK